MNNILELQDVRYSYSIGKNLIPILTGVNFILPRGEWCCIYGISGSGKTTLLNLIGGLDRPASGKILINEQDINLLSASRLAAFRARKIGFVFQSYCLLPELTVLENVVLAGRVAGIGRSEALRKAKEYLERNGLGGRMNHLPAELSGGEQQRAAIARALINSPELLLCDEPTGNLDAATGSGILNLFQELQQQTPEMSIVMITHNRDISALASIVVELRDGKLVQQDNQPERDVTAGEIAEQTPPEN